METGQIIFMVVLLGLTLPFTIFCGIEGGKAAKREGRQYDERQLLAQKGAYQVGFFVMMGYYALYGLLDIARPQATAFLGPVGIFSGLMAATLVFYLVTIGKGAYFPPKGNKKGMFWINLVLMACWLANVLLRLDEGFVKDGRLGPLCFYLEFVALYAVMTFAPLIKDRLDKRREASNTEDEDA